MQKLKATVLDRNNLSAAEIAEMYQLFSEYYEGISLDLFENDLAEKTHVIVLRSVNRLCGFSTLSLLETAQYRTLFSGDTIIHHDYWGEQGLALAFCNFAGQVKVQQPQIPLYWFLISKGYRTYRYLHLFSKVYWPSIHQAAAPELKHLLDILAIKKFGTHFNPATGVIRFPQSRGHLKSNWACIRENMLERPEVNFFLQRNPNFAEGEELACITLLDEDNLRSVARRAFVTGQRVASESLTATMMPTNVT